VPHELPILFLDIDGVLLAGRHWRAGHQERYPGKAIKTIPPEMQWPMNELYRRQQHRIVVSSTWRMDEECRDHIRRAGIVAPFHNDWRTGSGHSVIPGSTLVSADIRGEEIADWLRRHPEVTRYAIVDDDSDMLDEQLPFFVQTRFEEGLTMEHVDRLAEILGEGGEG
jgi:hypothetical protein